ncbi:MAG: hypothetical protein K0Q51_1467 [Rickettsiaceae bacterium]|jgi:UDP-N-acetylglucosamine 2-epimerase (non-hydrolysing)|nr:hypothetical protein [Rickettsiaceae bacterium]
MKNILMVIGTRPEAIKLYPVLKVLHQNINFKTKVCITKQHTELLDPIILRLNIKVDYQLINNQKVCTLSESSAQILSQLNEILSNEKPDLVIVQGDTTTAFSSALAAFYLKIPVAHIEAGLRTNQLYSPWPEEAHRSLIARICAFNFAPTIQAKNNLLREGISEDRVWVVGNTAIDAVRLACGSAVYDIKLNYIIITVTVHRRENHGERLKQICSAIREIAQSYTNVRIKFLLHPNPNVYPTVVNMLSGAENIDLIEPIDHTSFIQLLNSSTFIITDSGGVQEEASYLGKPVMIIRDNTERQEAVIEGTAIVIGTEKEKIISSCRDMLEKPEMLAAMSKVHFSYGDGYAAERILKVLESELIKGMT